MVNRLGFVPGESPVHGLHFWEPVVDGRPLRHILTDVPGDESADWVVGDNVPVLVHSWPMGLVASQIRCNSLDVGSLWWSG